MSQTKPGTLLRKQIPALVGYWKNEDIPGYLEIDLVSRSGEFASGTFIYTLSTVDLCTGWTERAPIHGKGQAGVIAALTRIREQLPFPLLGIHPDSGSEFINHFALCLLPAKQHRIYPLKAIPQQRQLPCGAEEPDPRPPPHRV